MLGLFGPIGTWEILAVVGAAIIVLLIVAVAGRGRK